MYDVITVGSATRDVFLISRKFQIIKSSAFDTGAGECVSLGSKIEIEKLVLTTGGGGTNAAVTFSQLGFNTASVVKIGDDAPGKDVLNDLKAAGVKTTLVKIVKGGQTGFATLLTTKEGERSVLVHRGVSGDFAENDVPLSKLNAKWVYMTSLGGNLPLAIKIAKRARKNGARVVYNPGSKELKKGVRAFTPILKSLTVLNINMEEAQILAKKKTKDIRKLAQAIAAKHLTLIITDGPNGAYAWLDGTIWFARPRNIKATSRTGAGDAFGSGLAASLANGDGVDDALKVGTINAESVIQSYGAKQGVVSSWPSKNIMKKIKIKTI